MFRIALLLGLVAVAVHGSALRVITVPRLRLHAEERIVGGHAINITDAPYQISFQRFSKHLCGGSIISEYHILTAAHCSIVDSNPEHLLIGSGSENLKALQKHKVERNEYHQLYNKYLIDYDVAILKVSTPFEFSATLKPVPYISVGEEPMDEESVVVTGWGALRSGGLATTALNSVEINIINHEVCDGAYAGFNPITPRMICAGKLTGGKDSCQGDSGGPMVSRETGKQVGIVSWGYGCAKPNYPGVYTNIADAEIQEFVQMQLRL